MRITSDLGTLLSLITASFALLGVAIFLHRLRRLRRAVSGAADSCASASAVSVIVPARDEAHNLPLLLGSLARLEPRAREVIVVDDHSTDGTGTLAAAAGALVLVPEAMEAGFLGKTWACFTGASAAGGDYLLFTDADTWHAPDSLARAVAHLERTGAGLVSIVPTHRVEQRWERLQGVFQLLLLIATRAGADPDAAEAGARRYANGQYLLFTRAAYEALGGHRAVSGWIAEDLAFTQRAAALRIRSSVLFAPGAVRVRMYPEGFAAFIAGWRRNFRDGLRASGSRAVLEMVAVMAWLIGVPLHLAAALAAQQPVSAAAWLAAYLGSAALIAREQRHYGPFSRRSALAYPLFSWVFVLVSLLSWLDALRGTPVRWRGRQIELAR